MSRKLDDAAWEKYITEFNSSKGSITAKEFCMKNDLNKNGFYRHKKRLEKEKIKNQEPIFHAISLENKQNTKHIQTTPDFSEVTITIGNANIAIPASETYLISSIIRGLAFRC